MVLYRQTGICVESFVEMAPNVPMSYEIDAVNDQATLYCGPHSEYVLTLERENLTRFVDLGARAMADLDAAEDPDNE